MKAKPAEPTFTAVLVPIEGSSQELFVQEQAVSLASSLAVPLRAIHVSTAFEVLPKRFFEYVENLARKRRVPFEKRVLHGTDVVAEIVDEASASEIIMVGTRLLGSEYHLGSVTEALIHRAPCPVQVIRIGPIRPERKTQARTARAKATRRGQRLQPAGWSEDA